MKWTVLTHFSVSEISYFNMKPIFKIWLKKQQILRHLQDNPTPDSCFLKVVSLIVPTYTLRRPSSSVEGLTVLQTARLCCRKHQLCTCLLSLPTYTCIPTYLLIYLRSYLFCLLTYSTLKIIRKILTINTEISAIDVILCSMKTNKPHYKTCDVTPCG